jgi:hypothetical protein
MPLSKYMYVDTVSPDAMPMPRYGCIPFTLIIR